MPWRLRFCLSPSGIFGAYHFDARYRVQLDTGFFYALQTSHRRNPIRGPPDLPSARIERQTNTSKKPFDLTT